MPWVPMQRQDDDPKFEWNPNLPVDQRADECWHNGRYQCLVRYVCEKGEELPEDPKTGMLHLSIHSHDRGPVRNWRHLQQIKNEVAGELRIGIELFPPEDKLTDTANEYHIWVFPEGTDLGLSLGGAPLVADDETTEKFNDEPHQGRQEPWEEGLTTGRTEHSDDARTKYRAMADGDDRRPPRIREL